MIFRKMEPRDIGRCLEVRTLVRENRYSLAALHQAGITEASVTAMLATTHQGWVCEDDRQIVGFSMGNQSTGEFWVVAVLPEYEGRGIGRQLMELVMDWLRASGCPELWLWTSPDVTTRAYALYVRSGWADCGIQNGQRIMKIRNAANRRAHPDPAPDWQIGRSAAVSRSERDQPQQVQKWGHQRTAKSPPTQRAAAGPLDTAALRGSGEGVLPKWERMKPFKKMVV